jgi:hypothetical protein
MLPVLSKTRAKFASGFSSTVPGHPGMVRARSLLLMGCLYIAASFFQMSWPYLLIVNHEQAAELARIPYIGWPFAAIWVVMIWCVPHLFYIGCKLISISRDKNLQIIETRQDKQVKSTLTLLLCLGILLDLVLFPFMLYVTDKGMVVFLSGVMGARVVQANMEAILTYHRL